MGNSVATFPHQENPPRDHEGQALEAKGVYKAFTVPPKESGGYTFTVIPQVNLGVRLLPGDRSYFCQAARGELAAKLRTQRIGGCRTGGRNVWLPPLSLAHQPVGVWERKKALTPQCLPPSAESPGRGSV